MAVIEVWLSVLVYANLYLRFFFCCSACLLCRVSCAKVDLCHHQPFLPILKSNSNISTSVKGLKCERSDSEWFGLKCSVLEKLGVWIVRSGGDGNQTSTSKSSLTVMYTKWFRMVLAEAWDAVVSKMVFFLNFLFFKLGNPWHLRHLADGLIQSDVQLCWVFCWIMFPS